MIRSVLTPPTIVTPPMSYQQDATGYVLRVSWLVQAEGEEIDGRNTSTAAFLLISYEDIVLCLLAVRIAFVLLDAGVFGRVYILWGYPGAYPGMTKVIRFWYPGTLRVLYPVHARERPKQSSLAPGYVPY